MVEASARPAHTAPPNTLPSDSAPPKTAPPKTVLPKTAPPKTAPSDSGLSDTVPLTASSKTAPIVTWELLPEDYPLPDDPVENIQQPRLAAALNDALVTNFCVPDQCLLASNFALVATIDQGTVVKAPDWLYVPQISTQRKASAKVRRSYTPWIEGDGVAIVMEFLSEDDNSEYSSRPQRPYGKLFFYEQILTVPTYVIFDPYTDDLEVRRLENDRYSIIPPDENGRYWIPEVNLYLGVWIGLRERNEASWLRWWDEQGNLMLWSSEIADLERQRAEQESARAEQELARAEQESARAEQESARAEQEAARAEQEAARAEQESARAEQESVRAEQESARAEQAVAERDRLLAKLRELGIEP